MSNPYQNLPKSRYWKTAVGDKSPFQISGLWAPKFKISRKTAIVTAGSCFAQHISRALVARGHRWIDAEPAPEHMMAQAKLDYHYGTFSFRTGNIYTTKMLQQWLSWSVGETEPPEVLWRKDGRFYDPFRPGVELGGFKTEAEAYASRAITIAAVHKAVEQANVFVFTLGLTEAWQNIETGVEYAVCPGTIAGQFDANKHIFVNHNFSSTYNYLKQALKLMRKINGKINILLTVSPVPLTATATHDHVLTATSQSKSILRAVAGEMKDSSPRIDYFPSYEIITHPAFRGMFYALNQRSVVPTGVNFVMENFFRDQKATFTKTVTEVGPYGAPRERVIESESPSKETESSAADDIRCEEEILDAFS
jgi:hypothetical protein